MGGDGEDGAGAAASLDHGVGFGKGAAHGLGGIDGLHAGLCQRRNRLRAFHRPGRHADDVGLLFGYHLAQVGVEGFHAPALTKVGKPPLIKVDAGNEFHVARFHDGRGVGPRPRIVGLADVLVINGAAHAAATDDRGAVLAFRRSRGHCQISARAYPIRVMRANSHGLSPLWV